MFFLIIFFILFIVIAILFCFSRRVISFQKYLSIEVKPKITSFYTHTYASFLHFWLTLTSASLPRHRLELQSFSQWFTLDCQDHLNEIAVCHAAGQVQQQTRRLQLSYKFPLGSSDVSQQLIANCNAHKYQQAYICTYAAIIEM